MSTATQEKLPSPFKNRNFTMLYFGQMVSQFGDWFKTVALISAIYALVPKAASVGGLFIASVLPVLFGGIIMGPLVDRWNKKYMMFWIDILRAGSTIGIIWGCLAANVWLIYLFIVLGSFLSAAFAPARASMIPEILKEQNIIQATTSMALLTSTTMVVASALGGFLTVWAGAINVLYFDAFSYLVSAVFIAMIKYTPLAKKGGPRLPYLKQVREGIDFVKKCPQLVSVFWLQFWRDFCLGFIYILFPLYALNELQAGDIGVGLGYSVTAAAYVIGAFLLKQYFKKNKFDDSAYFKIYFPSNMLYGIGLGVMFVIHNVYLFFAVMLLANIFQSKVNVITETSLMTYSKPELRGRVVATWLSMSRLAYGISLPLFSVIGGYIPSNYGGFMLGAICVISAAVLFLWLKGKLYQKSLTEEAGTA
ncbi:MFS transporter [Tumebacillus lipolyticus]|uniref:MFS transporter n=1 Tax=Tumebacillus lipolyticus TaxID=1280370 RepID=A0ABW5A227_9BACL